MELLLCAAACGVPAERFITIPQKHRMSSRMRPAEINDELRDFSLAIIITSPVNPLRAHSSRERDRRCSKDGRSRVSGVATCHRRSWLHLSQHREMTWIPECGEFAH